MREKLLHLTRAHILGVPLFMEQNKTLYPIGIRLLRANAIGALAVSCPELDSINAGHWDRLEGALIVDAFEIPN